MKDISKYQGVIPAFYACYDKDGHISVEGVKALTRHLIAKGVKGVYVGGSSGECIYQHPDERKQVLEAVMSEAKGKITVIAHVGCNNTADSVELAKHAESVGVDAIASIPPIYFHLPEYAIAKYWNAMSAAAPHTDFVIYNIPQLAGTALTMSLLKEMLKNPNVVAVKNSSMPTQDIQMFKDAGIAARGEGNFVVFNGPDEQYHIAPPSDNFACLFDNFNCQNVLYSCHSDPSRLNYCICSKQSKQFHPKKQNTQLLTHWNSV